MKIGLSDKYWKNHLAVSSDPAYIESENRRLAKQSACHHEVTVTFRKYEKYSTRCELCGAVTDSDAFHTKENERREQII